MADAGMNEKKLLKKLEHSLKENDRLMLLMKQNDI